MAKGNKKSEKKQEQAPESVPSPPSEPEIGSTTWLQEFIHQYGGEKMTQLGEWIGSHPKISGFFHHLNQMAGKEGNTLGVKGATAWARKLLHDFARKHRWDPVTLELVKELLLDEFVDGLARSHNSGSASAASAEGKPAATKPLMLRYRDVVLGLSQQQQTDFFRKLNAFKQETTRARKWETWKERVNDKKIIESLLATEVDHWETILTELLGSADPSGAAQLFGKIGKKIPSLDQIGEVEKQSATRRQQLRGQQSYLNRLLRR